MLSYITNRLVVFILLVTVGVGIACTAPREPVTPIVDDIEARVEATVKSALTGLIPTPIQNINATIEAGIEARLKKLSTSTPIPTLIPTVAPTVTPRPTNMPIPTAVPTIQSMSLKVRPSVVRIETDVGNGSGFIFQMGYPIAESGKTALVMTNYHVIKSGSWSR